MSALRTALGIMNAVLGAGTLLLPVALAPLAHSGAVSLVVAGALLVWSLLIGAAGGTRGSGPAGFVRARLGPRTTNVVHGLYFGGFAVGQAVVVGAAGQFVADGPAAVALGVVLLCLAAGLAAAGANLSPAVRTARLVATLALALVWWLFPGTFGLDPGRSPFGAAALIAVPVLFAWVGLEGSLPALRSPRAATTLGVVLGLVGAAALYGVLLNPPGSAALGPPAVRSALAWAAAVVLGTYCLTNLRAVGARWNTLRSGPGEAGAARGPGRPGIVVAVALAGTALGLAAAFHWSIAVLLLGPGTATAAIYAVLAVAALRRGRSRPGATGPAVPGS
ncbi:hypothetical protein ACFC0M_04945 [Streptomyces sp. NPDC056149]|uniref:hypothetical protein n=1 Tax=Streptomyces sp. NPDC056149 TaxID=3345728 RepID=UPI0035E0E512